MNDAAFFVEEDEGCNGENWNSKFPSCKLYTSGTQAVVQELRKVINEVSESTSRRRVLMADPGNTDYSHVDQTLFGTDDVPGAHMLISQQFVYMRGG